VHEHGHVTWCGGACRSIAHYLALERMRQHKHVVHAHGQHQEWHDLQAARDSNCLWRCRGGQRGKECSAALAPKVTEEQLRSVRAAGARPLLLPEWLRSHFDRQQGGEQWRRGHVGKKQGQEVVVDERGSWARRRTGGLQG